MILITWIILAYCWTLQPKGCRFDSRPTRLVGAVIKQCSPPWLKYPQHSTAPPHSSLSGAIVICPLAWMGHKIDCFVCRGMLCHNDTGSWSYPIVLSLGYLMEGTVIYYLLEVEFSIIWYVFFFYWWSWIVIRTVFLQQLDSYKSIQVLKLKGCPPLSTFY